MFSNYFNDILKYDGRIPNKYGLLFFIILLVLSGPANSQKSYIWPTNASTLLTSAFGEYRPDRIHAGIDIKTWNREGYKTFAVDDGYVMRVRVSPFGYGKAVYLRLKTGDIVLYGHLSRFESSISEIVRKEQLRTQSFSVDIWLKPSDLPVSQGDIIAYTGRSGSKLPHLHFEIRDSDNRPLNPLNHGFKPLDKTPPIPTKLCVIPLSVDSHLNGDWRPVVYNVKKTGESEYSLTSPVSVWGSIALCIDAFDMNGEFDNRYGIYKLSLNVNGEEKFSARYDRFSYNQNRLINLDRDYRLLRNDTGLFYNLYIKQGNTLNFYGPYKENDGILNFTSRGEESVPVEIMISDFFGNSSCVKIEFIVKPYTHPDLFKPKNLLTTSEKDTTGLSDEGNIAPAKNQFRVNLDYREKLLRIYFRASTDLQSIPEAYIQENNTQTFLDVRAKDKKRFVTAVPFNLIEDRDTQVYISGFSDNTRYDSIINLMIKAVTTSGRTLELGQRAGRVEFGVGDLYENLWFRHDVESAGETEYDIVSDIIHLEPKDVPLKSDVKVSLRYGGDIPDPEKLGLYARDNDGVWHFIGNEIDLENNIVSSDFSSLETVSAIRDTIPPVIFEIQPGQDGIISERRPKISVIFDDELSGFEDEKNMELYLNGAKVIAEWDPILKKIFFVPEKVLVPGRHKVRFTAIDRSGNRVEKEWEFVVR